MIVTRARPPPCRRWVAPQDRLAAAVVAEIAATAATSATARMIPAGIRPSLVLMLPTYLSEWLTYATETASLVFIRKPFPLPTPETFVQMIPSVADLQVKPPTSVCCP